MKHFVDALTLKQLAMFEEENDIIYCNTKNTSKVGYTLNNFRSFVSCNTSSLTTTYKIKIVCSFLKFNIQFHFKYSILLETKKKKGKSFISQLVIYISIQL